MVFSICYFLRNGDIEWKLEDGRLHRDNDKPATIRRDGSKFWYQFGKLHRDNDKPSSEYIDGTRFWHYQGEFHRDGDKPAYMTDDGDLMWYQHGKFHRENDQPAIIWAQCDFTHDPGTSEWYRNGEHWRENDKPTTVSMDGKMMWVNDEGLHRNGLLPAVINADETVKYFKRGTEYTLEELLNHGNVILRFFRRLVMKHKLRHYKRVSDMHSELLVLPPTRLFLGGIAYHKTLQKYSN